MEEQVGSRHDEYCIACKYTIMYVLCEMLEYLCVKYMGEGRDNYNSLTSAKLPRKNEDGYYLCGQKGRQDKHTN